LRSIAREILELVAESPADAPPALEELALKARAIERFLAEVPLPPDEATDAEADAA
jgi:hypothetical protein